MTKFVPRSVIDCLRDKFIGLEQGSMTVFEYEVTFQELFRHATKILPTQWEKVHCFVCGLMLQLRIDTESMASADKSFLDIVDHVRSMEELHREAQEGSDKRDYNQGSYSCSHYRGRDSYDKPCQYHHN